MGFRISWLAARGLGKRKLLDHFDLSDTAVPDDANESAYSSAELESGWAVLWSNDPTFATIERAAGLSRLAPVVSCMVNETSMFSMANYLEREAHLWWVGHNAAKGLNNLESEGELPPQFETIRSQLIEQQESYGDQQPAVDFTFDIPLELARSICGFKHDLCYDGVFTEAVPTPPGSKSFFGRFFG